MSVNERLLSIREFLCESESVPSRAKSDLKYVLHSIETSLDDPGGLVTLTPVLQSILSHWRYYFRDKKLDRKHDLNDLWSREVAEAEQELSDKGKSRPTREDINAEMEHRENYRQTLREVENFDRLELLMQSLQSALEPGILVQMSVNARRDAED